MNHGPDPADPVAAQQPKRAAAPACGFKNWATSQCAIAAVAALLIATVLLAAYLAVQWEQKEALRQASENDARLVFADEVRIRQTLLALDRVLLILRHDYQDKATMRHQDLQARVRGLHLTGAMEPEIGIADAQGRVRLASRWAAGAEANVSVVDRPYFQKHLQGNSDEMFIDVPVQSRLSQRMVVPMSRRISRPDGSFAGVVYLSIPPELFALPDEGGGLGERSVRTVVGLDGITRMRKSGHKIEYGNDVSKAQVFEAVKHSQTGSYIAKSAMDGEVRLVNYRVVDPYALLIVTGTAVAEVLKGTQAHTAIYVGAALLLSLLIAALAWAAVRNQAAGLRHLATLQSSAQRYQTLFEKTPVMHIVTGLHDGEPCVLDCNDKFATALGYTREQVIGRKIQDLLAPDSPGQGQVRQLVEQASEGTEWVAPRTLLAKNGRRLYTIAHITKSRDSAYPQAVARATFVDISFSIEWQKALFNSEEQFSRLIELIPQHVTITDLQGHIIWATHRVIDYVGAAHGDGQSNFDWLRQAIHPEDMARRQRAADAVLNQHDTSTPFEYRLRRHDGEYRWFVSETRPVLGDDGRISKWITTSTDIHAQKLSWQHLQATQRVEAIGQLTGGMAHDFNNLLAIIIGNLDMVLAEAPAAQDERRLSVALNAAERGSELVKSLLALASKQVLSPRHADVHALLSNMSPLLRQALGPMVELRLALEGPAPMVDIDVAGLESALLNLAVNAKDAMPDGGVFTVKIAVTNKLSEQTRAMVPWIHLTVSDTGHGMSPDVLARAREPFFTTKSRGHGSGLGLSMVAGFVAQSQGELHIRSEQGQGATFDIYLPWMTSSPARPALALLHATHATQAALAGTVLVVDDEAHMRDMVCEWLSGFGLQARGVATAEEALAICAQGPLDLLISDIAMAPGINGMALAEQAHAQHPRMPILLMSGYAMAHASGATLQCPWPVLPKPFRAAELRAALQDLLGPAATAHQERDHVPG